MQVALEVSNDHKETADRRNFKSTFIKGHVPFISVFLKALYYIKNAFDIQTSFFKSFCFSLPSNRGRGQGGGLQLFLKYLIFY